MGGLEGYMRRRIIKIAVPYIVAFFIYLRYIYLNEGFIWVYHLSEFLQHIALSVVHIRYYVRIFAMLHLVQIFATSIAVSVFSF